MKWFLAGVIALAAGCGDSGSSTGPDAGAGGGDGDGGSGDGDGGGTTGAQTVTLTLPNRPNNGAMFSFVVAYQDGSAAWQLAPAPTGDTYSFTINAPSYGVAFACIGNQQGGGQQRTVTSAHFAVGERTQVTLDVPARCSDRAGSTVMLSGIVSNRPAGGVLVVQYGTRTAFVGSQTGNFALQVPTGTRDLIVSHAVPGGNGDFYVDETVVVRDVAVTANTSKAINFATAQETEFFDVDVSAAPTTSRVVASTTLYTANGTTATLVRETQDWETDSLAEGQRVTTDVYDQSIAVGVLGSSATRTNATTEPAAQTWVSPAPLGAVMTTVPTQTPYVTLQSLWPAYPNAVGYLWNATQQIVCNQPGGCSNTWSAYLSPGVTGAAPGYVMPDLSALTGWKAAYELVDGAAIGGSVTAITSSAGASDFPTGIPVAGTARVFVRSDYGVSP